MNKMIHNFEIDFLGVRGTTPCADPEYSEYGGHTSCVMVQIEEHLILLDAGSGIINASKAGKQQPHKQTHLLLSHTHLDHIMGLPFYAPFWDKEHTVHMYCGNLEAYGGTQFFFENTFKAPLFPVPFNVFPAHVIYHDFQPTAHSFNIGEHIVVSTHPLNHPNGAVGYKIQYHDKSLCYITDHEHNENHLQRDSLLSFIRDVDVFIYDATFDDRHFMPFKGWGHSTWQEAIRLGEEAGVRQIAIFHHDPNNNDERMQKIEQEAVKTSSKAFMTKQGMRLIL